ncbi:alkylhydroperoxidase AhpD family core domain protein [Ostertagia ostertagi]
MPDACRVLPRARRVVGWLAASLTVTLAAEATEPRIERGLVVCRVAGQPIEADWVWPAVGTSRGRAVLFVHGGGWSAGSRRDYEPLALALAAQGYAGLLVDYRLAPAVRHPEAVQDLNCALRWLRRVAGERGVDPDHVAVIGGSAGAHLAGWPGPAGRGQHRESRVTGWAVHADPARRAGPTRATRPGKAPGCRPGTVWGAPPPGHHPGRRARRFRY